MAISTQKKADERDQLFRLLRLLDEGASPTQRTMATTVGTSLGRINTLLRFATDAGLIIRSEKTSTDGRQRIAYGLTSKGESEMDHLAEHFLARKHAEFDAIFT